MTVDAWSCPLPLRDQPNIVMGHGGGGKLGAELIEHLFLPAFDNPHLRAMTDAAVLDLPPGRIASQPTRSSCSPCSSLVATSASSPSTAP